MYHILFPNEIVFTFVSNLSSSFVHDRILLIEPPIKYATPYGGRLTYQMPGNNILVVHMKDSSKIRHKKRWSQVGNTLNKCTSIICSFAILFNLLSLSDKNASSLHFLNILQK